MLLLFANNSNLMVNTHHLKTNIIPVRHEIPEFYGNRIFITVLTTARHLSLTSFRWNPSRSFHPILLRCILILSSHLHDFFFLIGLLPSCFSTKTLYAFLFYPLLVTFRVCFVFLRWIWVIFGEECNRLIKCERLWRYQLRIFRRNIKKAKHRRQQRETHQICKQI